ncbi:MAG: DUF4412 domain-containing protein [Bacteroidia bacterium]|nr:DUF4412 domain-containing protein [Bacteroidia bacterium]
MKKIFSILLLTAFTLGAFAQFEGTIAFSKKTAYDTINYLYYIKGDKVRIDELNSKTGKVEGTFLIDLKAGTMTSLSHERKMYLEQKTPAPSKPAGECKVEKTKNTKTINGYKCVEYKVTNSTENTIVSHWVAAGKFNFFSKMLKVLNRKDKFSVYFQQIPGMDGMFPMYSTLSAMDGKVTETMDATKVEKKAVDAGLFSIPAGYTKFDK